MTGPAAPAGQGGRTGPFPPRLPDAITADPTLRRVLAALDGHQALIVGGAVRNALLGAPVVDIDIATDARPDRTTALARAAGLKAVPTGADHGTITVIADGRPFEVTTFRRDVETFGRRAVVAFSDDLSEDAQRRDFTMNALYARPDGSVIDPVGGLPDLAARRLRFVGDADARIAEDYLRILRFFRFHAQYGRPGAADPDALAACARHADGLDRISRERIGAELRKLLAAPDPTDAVALMADSGVLDRILPGADPTALAGLVAAEPAIAAELRQLSAPDLDLRPDPTPPDWRVRLAALGGADPAAALRLSRDETRALAELGFAGSLDEAAYRLGAPRAAQIALLRAGRGTPPPPGWADRISHAAAQTLPISVADLAGDLQGPALGAGLRAAEAAWIESGFLLPAPALIDIARLTGKAD